MCYDFFKNKKTPINFYRCFYVKNYFLQLAFFFFSETKEDKHKDTS